MSEHLFKRVEQLNSAYMDIRNALKVVKFHAKGDEADVHYYRIEKAMEALHKLILKDLKNEVIDEKALACIEIHKYLQGE